MNTFHHGGRIGDLVFALWTMKQLGGGHLYLTNFHHPNWDLRVAATLRSFLEYQPYVKKLSIVDYADLPKVDFDLRAAEDDYNPEQFPYWDHKSWPSNANILERYAFHFGIDTSRTYVEPWLEAPKDFNVDVAAHVPLRRAVRPRTDWIRILNTLIESGLRVVLLGTVGEELCGIGGSLLDSARIINSSSAFLGTVSSCNAIAEGLGKPRFVEHASDCFNVHPDTVINDLSCHDVVDLLLRAV